MERIKELRGLLVLVVLVLAFGVYRHASAQGERSRAGMIGPLPPVMSAPSSQEAAVSPPKHALVATYISNGNLGGFFINHDTFVPIDSPQTITCPGTSGTCLIQADHWVEVQGHSSFNEILGCLFVDGKADSNCGAVDDDIPSTGDFVQATSSHFVSGVSHGTHTVQTFVFTGQDAQAAYFNINYRVYKP